MADHAPPDQRPPTHRAAPGTAPHAGEPALAGVAQALNARPQVAAQRAWAERLSARSIAASPALHTRDEPPVQRLLMVGGAAKDAYPDDVYPFNPDVVTRWIGDQAETLEFLDWEEVVSIADREDSGDATALPNHRAVQWLRANGFAAITEADIIDPRLTAGNCHGFTFGINGTINFDSIDEFLQRWEGAGTPRVLLCLKRNLVAHSALWTGGNWRQTLPNGPIFTSSRNAVAASGPYQCFDLSIAGELAAVRQLSVQIRDAYLDDWRTLMARCRPAAIKSRILRVGIEHAAAGWYQEALNPPPYAPILASQVRNRLAELDDNGVD